MNALKSFSIMLLVAIVAACASDPRISQARQDAESHSSETFIQEARDSSNRAYVTVVDRVFIPGYSPDTLRDPDFFDQPLEYEARSFTKDDLYLQLMQQFQNRLVIDPDVLRHPRGKKVGHISSFSGTRKEFLNYLCHIYECSWTIQGGVAQVSRMVSKTWIVDVSSMVDNLDTQIQTRSRSGQSGNSGQVTEAGGTVSSRLSLDRFKEIEEIVKAMAGEGSKVKVSPANSVLMVTAPRDRIEAIDRFIRQMNRNARRLIAFQVEMVTVKMENGSDRGVNFDAVFNNGNLGVDFNILNLVDSDAGNVQVAITDPEDEFTGSRALIQSLSRMATITSRESRSFQVLDGSPLSLRKARKEAFFEVTTNVVPNTGQTLNEIKVSEVPVGISITMVPRITSGGKEILVSVQINNSELNRKETLSLGGTNFIQYPVTDNNDFSTYVRIRDGGAIVLALAETDSDSATEQGALHHKLPFLGGSRVKRKTAEKTFIIVRSEIL